VYLLKEKAKPVVSGKKRRKIQILNYPIGHVPHQNAYPDVDNGMHADDNEAKNAG
jgi:hypothetical protein